jgi:hypothetical protein
MAVSTWPEQVTAIATAVSARQYPTQGATVRARS